jgi:hypothetical protein
MTPEEIKAKASELAALYVAMSNGKILEYDTQSVGWVDNGATSGPDMQSDLSRWRVKPKPRRMWTTANTTIHDEAAALELQRRGMRVAEWLEVLS